MEPVPFQHTNERVLYRTKRSSAALLQSLLRSIWQGVVLGSIVTALYTGVVQIVTGDFPLLIVLIVLFVACVALLGLRAVMVFRTTVLTITTQRILFRGYDLTFEQGGKKRRHRSLFHALTHTLRWETYQESVYEGGFLSHLFHAGTLTIRHGTAEASRSLIIGMLPFAEDLKHYLDKIQSLKASKMPDSELPAFVPAKFGKRDQAVLTEIT